MVRTLFDATSIAVRNAVVEGQITNVSHMELKLRRRIFDVICMKQLQVNQNVIRLFEQPGFFNGFTSITMIDHRYRTEATDGRFLDFLAKTFSADQNLAENITDLTLRISCRGSENLNLISINNETKPSYSIMVSHLLSFCKNLKRLRLIATKSVGVRCDPDLYDCSRSAVVYLPALEQLSLIGDHYDWRIRQFPKHWFKSIQSLELSQCVLPYDTYVDIISFCRDTLTDLNLSDITGFSGVSLLPIELPKLTSFSFASSDGDEIIFEDLLKNCLQLVTAKVDLYVETISPTELAALANLSKRIQLHLTLDIGMPNHFHDVFRVASEDIVGLQLFYYYPDYSEMRCVFSSDPNFNHLELDQVSDQISPLLQDIVVDQKRLAKLTNLHVYGYLTETWLWDLLAKCTNLRHLELESNSIPLIGYGGHLHILVQNGIQLSSLRLCGFADIDLETVCALMRHSGDSLTDLHLNAIRLNENGWEMFLDALVNYCPMIKRCEITYIGLTKISEVRELVTKYSRLCFNAVYFYCYDGEYSRRAIALYL